MRVPASSSAYSAYDLLWLYESLAARPFDPTQLDGLVRSSAPALFDADPLIGKAMTGKGVRHTETSGAAVTLLGQPGVQRPLLPSSIAVHMAADPRAAMHVRQRAETADRIRALAEGPFDRADVEAAVRAYFSELAEQGLPLEPRPGSALAESFADGDLSELGDGETVQLLVLLALFGRNRHRPNTVARQPSVPLAPRGTWTSDGRNQAGGGAEQTGLNRPADTGSEPKITSGDIPTGTLTGRRLATTAREVAEDMNTTGWCFKGAAESVARATGVSLSGKSAYMAADQLAASGQFGEARVSPDQLERLPAGAVVVWGRTARSPHGHISIALGNGQEASDHVQKQITTLRGASNYRVFIPK